MSMLNLEIVEGVSGCCCERHSVYDSIVKNAGGTDVLVKLRDVIDKSRDVIDKSRDVIITN